MTHCRSCLHHVVLIDITDCSGLGPALSEPIACIVIANCKWYASFYGHPNSACNRLSHCKASAQLTVPCAKDSAEPTKSASS